MALRITLDAFSGRPNPTVTIDGPEADQVDAGSLGPDAVGHGVDHLLDEVPGCVVAGQFPGEAGEGVVRRLSAPEYEPVCGLLQGTLRGVEDHRDHGGGDHRQR